MRRSSHGVRSRLKLWPTPTIWLEAKLAHKKRDEDNGQQSFGNEYGRLSGDRNSLAFASGMAKGYREGGWKGALSKAPEARLAERKSAYVPYELATLYANLGDNDGAFQWLDSAYRERNLGFMRLNSDFLLGPIRSDRRFSELVRKVGLPQ